MPEPAPSVLTMFEVVAISVYVGTTGRNLSQPWM